MIRIPAIPAVLLAVTSLTGCQVLQTPGRLPEGQTVTEQKVDSPIPVSPVVKGDKQVKPEKQPEVTLRQTIIQTPAYVNGKLVVGLAETGYLPDLDLQLDAKIDTGASRTSIDARNLQPFERDGKEMDPV